MYEAVPDDRCKRIGCPRRRTGQNLYRDCCGPVCSYAYRLHNEAQTIAEYLGHSDPVDDYLLATLEIGKTLERAHKARTVLRRFASEAGWTTEQWDELIQGRYGLAAAATGQAAG